MGASAAQFDIIAGLDISPIASPNQSQIMQAINEIAPYGNIGFVVVMNGGGGTDWPSVANNPRFKRYIWLDTYGGSTPAWKIYDQSGTDGYANWVSVPVSALSITNSMIANATIQIGKLSTTGGTARYILRENAAGTAIEFCNPNAIFAANDVPLNAINVTAAPAGTSYLKYNGSTTAFSALAFSDFPGGSLVSLSQITPASGNRQLLWYDGTVQWGAPSTLFSTVGDLPLGGLAQGGASSGDVLSWNGTNWAKRTIPYLSSYSSTYATTVPLANFAITFTHGLGAVPRSLRAVLVCVVNDLDWLVGEELNIHNLADSGDAGPCAAVAASSTTIFVSGYYNGGFRVIRKDGTARSNIAANAWKVKVYAEL